MEVKRSVERESLILFYSIQQQEPQNSQLHVAVSSQYTHLKYSIENHNNEFGYKIINSGISVTFVA